MNIEKECIENTNDYELIMLYRENDEDAKNILFYKYKFIIDILIKKYRKYLASLNADFQEVYSECNVGFSDGLKCYEDDKDTSLPTFITLCIERRIANIIKKYSSNKYKAMKDTYSLDFDYDDNANLLDFIADSNDPLKNIMEEEDYEELVKNIKSNLTKNEYDVFLLMVKGLSYIEIAKILGKSPKQIDNSIQRLKNKIKKIKGII